MCGTVGVLVTFALVVHVGRFVAQKVGPVLETLLHRQIVHNPLQRALAKHAVADDFLVEVVDQVGISADLLELASELGPISECEMGCGDDFVGGVPTKGVRYLDRGWFLLGRDSSAGR